MRETDSLEVINVCTDNNQWWDTTPVVYTEIVDLATWIEKVKFKHCNRDANGVAHELARFSFCNNLSSTWDGDLSSFLIGKLVDDVNISMNE